VEIKRWRGLPLQLFAITAMPLIVLLVGVAVGGLTLHQRAMRTLVGERDERSARAAAAAINEQLGHRAAAIHSLVLQAAATAAPQETLTDATFLLPDFDGGIALLTSDVLFQEATNEVDFWQSEPVVERLAKIEPGPEPQWRPSSPMP